MAALNAFARAFWEMPPVTRMYMAASVATTFAVQIEIISPFQLYFNPKLIFKSNQLTNPNLPIRSYHQYWRLITTFLFFGPLGFNFLFNLVFTYRYCRMLEEEFFRNRTADFFYMFLVGGVFMSMLAYFVNLLFLGHAFTIMLVYIWSRRNPGVRMNFFGLLTFQAPYLPWVLLAFSILLGSSTVVDIIGIIVGHFYYFFEDVFPNGPHGFRILETPRIIKTAFNHLGFDDQLLMEEDRPEQFDFANALNRPNMTENVGENPEYQQADSSTTTTSTSSTERTETLTSQQPPRESNDSVLRARNVGENSSGSAG